MADHVLEVDEVECMRAVVLHIKLKRHREMLVREWIARQLIRLVGVVLNCNIAFED